MGSFNVNPTTILGKIHVRTPAQAEPLSSRYVFLNVNNAEPNLGKPPGIYGGTYYSTLTSDEYLGIRYALLSNNHSGSAWRVWAYNNPKIAAYSKEGSLGIGDNAYPLNIKSFVYSNYAFDNQNNRYNSQSFSNKTFNVFALSGIYLFDSTTIGDPASAIAFIVTDTGNVGVGTETPEATFTVAGTISGNNTWVALNASNASGNYSFASGYNTTAIGNYSNVQGINNEASGYASHAQGASNIASNSYSHAQGNTTKASGESSHAAGQNTLASGLRSTATGQSTSATKTNAYASGKFAWANHNRSWVWQGTPVDTVDAQFISTRTDQFAIRPANGFFLSGAMGINTDSIDNALTVYGNISASGSLSASGLRIARSSSGTITPDPNSIAVFEGGGSANISILTPNAQTGGLVFGSPADNFGSYLSWNHDNNALKLATANPDGYIQLLTNNEAEAVRITSTGSVGIGTTLPEEKLTVVGNISARDGIKADSLSARFINLIYSPANDGSNPLLKIGETGTAGFSGFNLLYNENQNRLQLVTDFAGVSLTAASIDRNANVSGPIFPYMVTLTPTITSNFSPSTSNVHFPSALSGVIDASEITSRLAFNKGVMQMRFHCETPVSVGTNKRLRVEFANNANFSASTNIINTADANFLSMSTTREGLISIAGNAPQQIIFQSVGASDQDGKQGNPLLAYTYVAGDPIYWRVGLACAVSTDVYALCAGYIRISPY